MYKQRFAVVKYGMIVAKFGGTAVTPRNMIYVKRIVNEAHGAVVVSAVGKEFKEDVKVTDLLLAYFDTRDETLWATIADKYRRLVRFNGIAVDIGALLDDAHSRALSFDRQYCASIGEELSARIASCFLNIDYAESAEIVRFDETGVFLADETCANVRSVLSRGRHVLGGFYGGYSNGGRRTFSRGGGDVTGAIVAAALDATLYENWTDVNGVCVANPSRVHNVATVAGMSYREMRMLSLAGAEVLHPDAVAPCERRAVPIRIGNVFNPNGASTLISPCQSCDKLLSVAEKAVEEGYLTTVLHSYPDWIILRKIGEFSKSCTKELHFFDRVSCVNPVIKSVYLAQNVLRIVSSRSILTDLYKFLTV